MSTTITWLGHGTFSIETDGKTVIIDPFFTGNPAATTTADEVSPDALIISHGHGDHVGDAVEIARRTGCLVVANHEIIEWLAKQGVENVHAQHIGGSHKHDFGTVKLTIAHHGSSLPDGSNGGNPCGIVLKTTDGTIYHACDTGLFYDMKLIGEEGIDVAILPIGDNFTMGPEDALKAVKLIEPKRVIPDHFGTWPLIDQDVNAWATSVRCETSAEPVILEPGQSVEL
ncbi:MAG: metal-dependent hydrolase [Planctomycetota bacterium]|nr:metal-dependent hydrolase [Planctomycetota bacterium]MDA1162925.1 metal-dependent hydrolase [Planctomycetota bacterium]